MGLRPSQVPSRFGLCAGGGVSWVSEMFVRLGSEAFIPADLALGVLGRVIGFPRGVLRRWVLQAGEGCKVICGAAGI